jgi:3-oxocholest-4-en-26-oate---CoA ligase
MNLADLFETVVDNFGERDAMVTAERRLTYAQLDERANRLANHLREQGVGPGDHVGLQLVNGTEYVEGMLAAYKIRAVPINVNYRYLADEVHYVLENADAEALVFHTSLADQVAPIVERLPKLKLVVGVDDGGNMTDVKGAVGYEELLAAHDPAPRIARPASDRTMFFTGGTTGMPKGVLGRVGPGVHALAVTVPPVFGHAPANTIDEVIAITKTLADTMDLGSIPACPLMHGTGMTLGALIAMLFGGKVALMENRKFDAGELWDLAAAEHVTTVAIVGDPFARPMLAALDAKPGRDLSEFRFIVSAGAMFSTEMKEAILRHIPHATIFDYIASTEAAMGVSISTAAAVAPTGKFLPNPGIVVLDEDDEQVAAGSGVAGIVGVPADHPDGYYKDAAKSAATFREVRGVTYSFPGDWATIEADGQLQLLGRGSQCINTGGEKVFPEEVEEVIKRSDGVDDCLIFGIPDERFGQRVAAVVQPREGMQPTLEELGAFAREWVAGYKVPRDLRLVSTIGRTASGKADYAWARRVFADT